MTVEREDKVPTCALSREFQVGNAQHRLCPDHVAGNRPEQSVALHTPSPPMNIRGPLWVRCGYRAEPMVVDRSNQGLWREPSAQISDDDEIVPQSHSTGDGTPLSCVDTCRLAETESPTIPKWTVTPCLRWALPVHQIEPLRTWSFAHQQVRSLPAIGWTCLPRWVGIDSTVTVAEGPLCRRGCERNGVSQAQYGPLGRYGVDVLWPLDNADQFSPRCRLASVSQAIQT